MDVWIADPIRDAARVATLRYAWARTSGATTEPMDDGFVDAVRDWWIRDGRTVFLAGEFSLTGGGAAAMVTLHEYRRMPMPGADSTAWGYVGHLFVLPAARREGYGRALVEAVQQAARDRGYRRLVLSPSDESVPLYRRRGFRAADELMVWEPDPGSTS
ncbi:GNAT family N-acetyltransferase [Tsukamurella sputi]|uniref:GNAT family N-acetyltransferase n=1 Tax=Tsukamurella sputi TaxID=2591848 RepID=A0A5C5RUT0_9ACTN|nr:GNAT family N-acetyltransferase [Tsukamurella sputi]TWS26263.1 GNAT family N-acetyltransferase [Tsukamurella sputi]